MVLVAALVACSDGSGGGGGDGSPATDRPDTSQQRLDAGTAPGDTSNAPPSSPGSADAGVGTSAPPATDTVAPPAAMCDLDGVASGSAAATTTLTIWHYLADRAEQELVAEVGAYEAEHPDVDVVVVPFDGTRAELEAWDATAPADRPDLLLVSDDHIGTLAGTPGVLPFDDCLDGDGATLVPQVAATYTIGGRLQAAPYLVSTPVLYYDATAFEEAGIDGPPATLDELRSVLAELVSSGAAPSGFAVETGSQSGGSWYVEQWLAQLGIDSLTADNGRAAGGASAVNWNAPEAVEGLTFLAELVAEGLATVVDDSSGSADLLLMVSTDPAAMAVQTSASIGEVLDVLDQGGFGGVELGVGPLPGPGRGGFVGGAAWWAAAGHDAARQQAALDLVLHLTSPEAQAQLASTTGYVPVRQESLDEPVLVAAYAARPQLRVGVEQVLAMPTDPSGLVPVSPLRTTLREMLGEAVTAVLVGGADPQAALDAAAADADRLLASA